MVYMYVYTLPSISFFLVIEKAMSILKYPKIFFAVMFALLLSVGTANTSAEDIESLESIVNGLSIDGFDEKSAAIEALTESQTGQAEKILTALLQGSLYTRKNDGKVVIVEKLEKRYLLLDPIDLTEIGQATKKEVKKIRINNRLRKHIRGALGRLTLFSSDPVKRRKAADAFFQNPRAADALILEEAVERETDKKTLSKMIKALAAIHLGPENSAEKRITAIRILESFTEPEVRSLLATVIARDENGDFLESNETVRIAADQAFENIQNKLRLYGILEILFHGLSLGSVLLLAAIGLAITFGVMGVINMAHGEMVMLGAYTTFLVQELFRNYLPGGFDYSLLVAIPFAFAVSGIVGIVIERGIIRYLYGRPLETLLATWGLSLVLQQLVRTVFGPTNREVGTPTWMMGALDLSGGIVLPYNRIYIIVFSITVLIALLATLRHTTFGLRVRAVTQNRSMAGAMGIRTGRVDALTFGLGCGIAGMAGVALSQIDNVSPNLGQAYIIDSFMVVVFGGVGNLWGTLVGAMSLGIVNKFLEPYAGAVLGKILVLVFIILFIQKRPRGLFALKGRAVEQ